MSTTYLTLDLPALHRHFVGFDQIFEDINRTFNMAKQDNYPPHNIIRTGENSYLIELAVAGFTEAELDVEVAQNQYGQNVLTVRGERKRDNEGGEYQYLFRGLANRNFERTFTLQDHVEVLGVNVANGIMTVSLEQRVPETQKAKKVAITFSK